MAKKQFPSISICIPTYNAARVLDKCLMAIASQDYPKSKIEIVIGDGGSDDDTIKIAKKYGGKIFHNKLRTGESGKSVAVKHAKNEIIALIDSDNILPGKKWLQKMVEPFEDKEIIGSEPIKYTYRKKDHYITRYSALTGVNDPICIFLGNYDRYNVLTGKWTGLDIKTEDRGNYIVAHLEKYKVPTIGANGTMMRRKLLDDGKLGDYLFDIDEIYRLMDQGKNKFAKVKIGIIHLFCSSVHDFRRKQKRRIMDYSFYNSLGIRKYPWSKLNKAGFVKFVIYSALWLPTFGQALIGYTKKPDNAWFFHPLACWLTLWIYGWGKIGSKLFGAKELNRRGWKQ